jgi:hypothetical protein
MGVTSIKTIINKTNELIEIIKREDPRGDSVSLPSGDISNEEIWLPWVENQKDFNTKTIEITYTLSNKKIYLWQTGDKVRYSKTGYENPGKAVIGVAQVDGDRKLVIENDNISLLKL